MTLTADSPVFLRAERLNPVPVSKKPLPDGWAIPEPEVEPILPSTSKPKFPLSDGLAPQHGPETITEPTNIASQPTITREEQLPDDFGADLGLSTDSSDLG